MLKTVDIKNIKIISLILNNYSLSYQNRPKNTPKTRGSFSERIVLKHDMKNIEPGKRIAACE